MAEFINAQDLQRAAIFSELSAHEAGLATQGIQQVQLQAGDILFHQGDPGDSLYFVISGELKVSLYVPEADDRVISKLGPNSMIGEMGLLLDEPRSATVSAATDAELWMVSRDKFNESIAWNERWANQFLFYMAQVLARRLLGMNDELVVLLSKANREGKIAKYYLTQLQKILAAEN
jgi:CRP/FNR family transcriptional regulator